MRQATEVTPAEAARRQGDGAMLLDVREPDEFDAGHAPEARLVPLSTLGDRLDELDRQRPVVAVCRVGGRSAHAARVLSGLGYDAVNLAGGMQAWQDAGLPVVTAQGGSGDVA